MSTLKVNSIIPVAGVPTGGGGGIIQVVQAYKNDIFSSTSSSFVDVTGLALTITPTSTSSKVLIRYDVLLSGQSWTKGTVQLGLFVSSDGGSSFTIIGNGTGGDSNHNVNSVQQLYSNGDSNTEANISGVSLEFLHSPSSTAALQYKLQARIQNTGNFKINAQAHSYNGSSSMTAMEVSA
tara:strand:+ start:13 stop:552 length:540 start_codon:yes stop_codon:yes gene_type:complete